MSVIENGKTLVLRTNVDINKFKEGLFSIVKLKDDDENVHLTTISMKISLNIYMIVKDGNIARKTHIKSCIGKYINIYRAHIANHQVGLFAAALWKLKLCFKFDDFSDIIIDRSTNGLHHKQLLSIPTSEDYHVIIQKEYYNYGNILLFKRDDLFKLTKCVDCNNHLSMGQTSYVITNVVTCGCKNLRHVHPTHVIYFGDAFKLCESFSANINMDQPFKYENDWLCLRKHRNKWLPLIYLHENTKICESVYN